MNDIPVLNLFPEKWRGWLLIAAWAFPYATRIAHAAMNGHGIVGAVKAVLFGVSTNQSQPQTKQP